MTSVGLVICFDELQSNTLMITQYTSEKLNSNSSEKKKKLRLVIRSHKYHLNNNDCKNVDILCRIDKQIIVFKRSVQLLV